jgi:hypothetical protein
MTNVYFAIFFVMLEIFVAISIDGILFPALSNDGQLFKVGTSCPA